MFQRNKILLLGAAACAGLWLILFFVLVSPRKSQRQEEIGEAKKRLKRWAKYYQPAKDGVALPKASQALAAEQQLLRATQKQLKAIEFASTEAMQSFTLAASKGEDPNNYFARKRKEVLAALARHYKIKLLAGLNDLGFRGKITDDPVALNLVRLFALNRFFQAGARAGVSEVLSIKHFKPQPVAGATPEEAPGEPLIEIPMILMLRATEQNFAQLLYELQRPSNAQRSYFCLRGFSVSIKDTRQGVVDVVLAVGALFPRGQFLKELQVPFKEEKRTTRPTIRVPDY